MSTAHNLVDRTGQRFGRLTVLERQAPDTAGRMTWLCRCDCGNECVVRGDHLAAGRTVACGCQRGRNRDVVPTYNAVHKRVQRERGAAVEHDCVDCGGVAEHWSYDGQDPAELTEAVTSRGRAYRMRFSTRPEHYAPRCALCHKRFDTTNTEERAS